MKFWFGCDVSDGRGLN